MDTRRRISSYVFSIAPEPHAKRPIGGWILRQHERGLLSTLHCAARRRNRCSRVSLSLNCSPIHFAYLAAVQVCGHFHPVPHGVVVHEVSAVFPVERIISPLGLTFRSTWAASSGKPIEHNPTMHIHPGRFLHLNAVPFLCERSLPASPAIANIFSAFEDRLLRGILVEMLLWTGYTRIELETTDRKMGKIGLQNLFIGEGEQR